MGFPFIIPLDEGFESVLKSRKNTVANSKLYSWITITSNLGKGKTLGSETYQSFNQSYTNTGQHKGRPNPIVSGFSIDFSARGTLRRATVNIQCFNSDQLTEMLQYFLEPGASIFIQWGWNRSALTSQKVGPIDVTDKSNVSKLELIKRFYRDSKPLNEKREETEYCYDNMLGIITGGESSVNNEKFEIVCKVSSLGEIITGGNRVDGTNGSDAKHEVTEYGFLEEAANIALGWFTTGNPKRNWIAFFNSLPDEYKRDSMKKWGENNSTSKSVPSSYKLYKQSKINWVTDFINFDSGIIETAISETTKNMIINEPVYWLGKIITPHGTTPVSSFKYIKFSALILLLNRTQSDRFRIGTSNSVDSNKLFYINIDDSYCSSFNGIFSPDERIFIPNKTAYNFPAEIKYWIDAPTYSKTTSSPKRRLDLQNKVEASQLRSTKESTSGDTLDISIDTISFPITEDTTITSTVAGERDVVLHKNQHGWLGDIYVEWELAKRLLNDTKDSIKESMDRLLSDISDATDGYWQFQIVVDEKTDGYLMRIAESSVLNQSTSTRIAEFNFYGTNSIFLSANLSLDIPKAMASKVVMSTAAGEKKGELAFGESGIVSLFNSKGYEDTLLPELIKFREEENPDANITIPPMEDEDIDKTAWSALANTIKIGINPSTPIGQGQPGQESTNVDEWSMPMVYLNKALFTKLSMIEAKKASAEKKLGRSLPLPIKFEFSTIGTSGFKFGQLFKVKGLPQQYSEPGKGAFMVQEVKHKIDGALWTTEVGAIYRPYQV